jgi:hypothetical protein
MYIYYVGHIDCELCEALQDLKFDRENSFKAHTRWFIEMRKCGQVICGLQQRWISQRRQVLFPFLYLFARRVDYYFLITCYSGHVKRVGGDEPCHVRQ